MSTKEELRIMFKELNDNEDLQIICDWIGFGMK
jgi:hypothetical protein